MVALDRRMGAEALYVQVKRLVKGQIAAGEYEPGDRLPTEHSLANTLSISRATVIRALDELSREGVVVRRQGSGTYVAQFERHALVEVAGFTAVTQAQGAAPAQRLLSMTTVDVGQQRDELLSHFPDTVALTVLERLRFTNGIPVGHHRVAVPTHIFAESKTTESHFNDPHFSLYETLAQSGNSPIEATQTLRAVPCTDSIATALNIEAGSPVMATRRFSRNTAGRLVEAVDATYIGSLYEYEVEIAPLHPLGTTERQIDGTEATGSARGDLRVAVAERVRRHCSRK